MKKWAAILLFSIYALGTTALDQLLRVPLLVKHYIGHRAENPGMTISTFIRMHYIEEQQYDADYAQDMELPFKKADTHCIILPSILPDPIITVYHKLTFPSPKYFLFDDQYTPLTEKDALLKPPRA
jgi:hypothetical protein